MNSDSLLNIINVIIKNDKNFSESPDEIYSLFKKHGYEGDIETLKLDLKNLLNDVIKSDEELSKVAGGKVSKLAAGAVAALTCLPMNSFASGTANTSRNKQSNVNKITDTIKSGAKKVGDATKEYVIEPAKDAAKTIARNPGKSAAVTTALVAYGLLSGLAGKKLASPPKVDTQGMTAEEQQKADTTYKVLHELTANNHVVIEGDEKKNKEYSWNLDKLEVKPDGLPDKVKIGGLVKELMPETIGSNPPTTTYTQVRKAYIEYEEAQLATLKQIDTTEALEKAKRLETENGELQEKLARQEEDLEAQKKNIEDQKKEHEEELEEKNKQLEKLTKQNKKNEEDLKKKENENAELTKKNEAKDRQITNLDEQLRTRQMEYNTELGQKDTQIDKLKKEATEQASELETLSAKYKQMCDENETLREQLDKADPEPKNAAKNVPIISRFSKIKTIRKTIDKALGKYVKDISDFKDAVQRGGPNAYNALRNIYNNFFNKENQRTLLSNSWSEFTGAFSLAEILLPTTSNSNTRVKGESSLAPVNTKGFNLDASCYKKNNDLRKAAQENTTWLKWLAPAWGVSERWCYGLASASVVAQLPELIIAAGTLANDATLISLLDALQTLLSSPANSGYRRPVNEALKKVCMRFDDKACELVTDI